MVIGKDFKIIQCSGLGSISLSGWQLVEKSSEVSVYSGSVMSVLSGETISRFHWRGVSIESRKVQRIMDHNRRGKRSADQVSLTAEKLRIVSLADYLPGD